MARARFTDELGFNWEVEDFVSGGLYATQLAGEGELGYQWFPDSDLIAMGVNPTKLMELDMKLQGGKALTRSSASSLLPNGKENL